MASQNSSQTILVTSFPHCPYCSKNMLFEESYLPLDEDVCICEHCGGVIRILFKERRGFVPQCYQMTRREVNNYMTEYPEFFHVWMKIKAEIYGKRVEALQVESKVEEQGSPNKVV
jgi:hypothetical protein